MQINNSTSQSNFGMALGPRLKEYSQVANYFMFRFIMYCKA